MGAPTWYTLANKRTGINIHAMPHDHDFWADGQCPVCQPKNLGSDTPWPLRDVLLRLADAADHLLHDHGCDAHGWEGIGIARDYARIYANQLVVENRT